MRQWRLIYDYPTPGADNMAIDEAILEAVSAHHVPPTLRVYAWNPACLSLGYGQRASDVDFERAKALGYSVVRRPTGGRAILHTDELTYSLSLPAEDEIAGDSILESYRRISGALVAGLAQLGVQPQASEQTGAKQSVKPVCFEITSHYEITFNQRKLVGSAQLRRKKGLLQHGSLPLFGDIGRICDVLAYSDEAERVETQQHVREHAVTLSQALASQTPKYEISQSEWQSVADAITQGFVDTFQVDFTAFPNQLTQSELEHASILVQTVYSTEMWTHRR